MKGKLILSLTALAVTSTIYAGTMADVQMGPQGGWVIGGDIGYGYLSTQEAEILSPTANTIPVTTEIQDQNHKIGDLVGGGYVGYNFPLLARVLMGVEVGYKYQGQSRYKSNAVETSFGNFLRNHISVTQQAVDALVTSKIYLWRGLNLIGKGGAAYVGSRTKDASQFNLGITGSLTTKATIWRIRPEFDLGFGYTFNNKIDLNLIYTHIGGTDANTVGSFRYYNSGPDKLPGVFEYNALTVGLSYTFG